MKIIKDVSIEDFLKKYKIIELGDVIVNFGDVLITRDAWPRKIDGEEVIEDNGWSIQLSGEWPGRYVGKVREAEELIENLQKAILFVKTNE